MVPAKAGPFDLGTVVVRAAIYIDPHTAQVTDTSDPFPQIIDGIPLEVKHVRTFIDRPGLHVQLDQLQTDERDGDGGGCRRG
jgi:hypothetical protein